MVPPSVTEDAPPNINGVGGAVFCRQPMSMVPINASAKSRFMGCYLEYANATAQQPAHAGESTKARLTVCRVAGRLQHFVRPGATSFSKDYSTLPALGHDPR